MIISAFQVLWFTIKEKSLVAFETQVRIVYFATTLFGFWPAARLYVFVLLLIGTFMVAFFDKCSIAMVIKKCPGTKMSNEIYALICFTTVLQSLYKKTCLLSAYI